MKILTVDNQTFSLNNLPDEVEDTIQFCILDNTDQENPDFFFQPLIFLESFNAPAAVLKIGDHEIIMPVDWCIAIGDSETFSDIEIIPITSLNNRGFEAMVFNPLRSSYSIQFKKIEILNFYNDVKWYFPKVKNGQLLAIPLEDGDNPVCAYFIKEVTKQYELIQLSKLF